MIAAVTVLLTGILAHSRSLAKEVHNGTDKRAQVQNRELRLSAAAPRQADSPEIKRLLAAARQNGEDKLEIVWGEQSFGGYQGAKLFEELFNRMYGLNVKVNFTPGPAMPAVVGKVTQEVAARQRTSTDVLLGTETHYAALRDRGVLEEYDYTKLSPRIIKEVVTHRNIGVEVATFVSGVTYNTNFIPPGEAPKKLEDVLSPRWKGKIASTPYAAQFDRIALLPNWGAEKTRALVSKLSGYIGGLIRCGEMPRLVSGEFILFVMDCGSYYVRLERAKGAPLGHVILEDGATMSFFYWGIPRTAPHPNLAKLFINMAMSEEGQKIIYKVYATDHYLLPSSQSAAELSNLRAKGIEPLKVDAKFVAEHPELNRLQDDLQKLLQQKRPD
jgi:iron(III) transport system substrate-binding protein